MGRAPRVSARAGRRATTRARVWIAPVQEFGGYAAGSRRSSPFAMGDRKGRPARKDRGDGREARREDGRQYRALTWRLLRSTSSPAPSSSAGAAAPGERPAGTPASGGSRPSGRPPCPAVRPTRTAPRRPPIASPAGPEVPTIDGRAQHAQDVDLWAVRHVSSTVMSLGGAPPYSMCSCV